MVTPVVQRLVISKKKRRHPLVKFVCVQSSALGTPSLEDCETSYRQFKGPPITREVFQDLEIGLQMLLGRIHLTTLSKQGHVKKNR